MNFFGLKFRIYVLALISVLSASLSYAQSYDEIRDEDGQIRPLYQNIYERWESLSNRQRQAYLRASREAFRGDNALDPLPRVISDDEYNNVIRRGVEQRAKALVAFLEDHFSGRRRYQSAGIIPERVLRSIINRSGESDYESILRNIPFSFIYGPDLIRDADGVWRVLEDNTGFVGGLGDLEVAQDFYRQNFPDVFYTNSIASASDFYKHMIDRYKQIAESKGGIAVLYQLPPYSDNEDVRMRQIFARHGVPMVTQNTDLQLSVEQNGVYAISKSTGKKSKVGMVVMNGENWWLDPSHRAHYRRIIRDEAAYVVEEMAKDISAPLRQAVAEAALLERQESTDESLARLEQAIKDTGYNIQFPKEMQSKARQARGLTEAFLNGQVAMSSSPGTEFLSDKEFYIYVEDLIRFYLKEEPIIRNVETESFANRASGKLREALFNRVFADIKSYVIKAVDGRGGSEVWIGNKLDARQRNQLKKRIQEDPDLFIAQKRTPLSEMNELIVDMRVHTVVTEDKVWAGNVPWGRGQLKSGDGKVNLSGSGREVTVLVVKKNSCKESLTKKKK